MRSYIEHDRRVLSHEDMSMPQAKETLLKKKNSGYSLLGFSLAVLVCAGVLLIWQVRSEKSAIPPRLVPVDPVVATINEEPVSADEYRLIMERKAPLVYAYFKEHYNLDDHLGYWNEITKPENPLAKLREMTREELIRIKVYQGQAKIRGFIKETTFADFRMEFDRENARRSAAQLAGQVIYGPPQYRLTSYYYVRLGDLVYRVKQALAQEAETGISEGEIKKFYKENKTFFEGESLVQARQAILKALSSKVADKELDALCATATVDIKETAIRLIVPRLDPKPDKPSNPTSP